MSQFRDDDFLLRFGQRLRKARLSANKSQEQLADDVGVSQVQVTRIESGKLNTSISLTNAFCTALHISSSELFDQ